MKISTQRYAQDLRRYYRLPEVQVSLTLVLTLFLMAVFIVFALRPTIVSIVTLRKTIVESKKTLQQLETKVANLQVAANELETIKPFLPTLNTNIPNQGAKYAPLTFAIENLALQSGVRLESENMGPTLLFSRILTPFAPNKKQNIMALPFAVRVSGSYPNIAGFLSKLLSIERVLGVETVTIIREAGSKSEGGGVTLNVSGSAYYLADEAQLIQAMGKANK